MVVRHDQHVRSRRKIGHDRLRDRRVVEADRGDRVGERPGRARLTEASGSEHLRARVDEVQLHLLPREDACELEADVSEAEDRDGWHSADRFEQHGDFASAALDAVFGRDPVVEGEGEKSRLTGPFVEHLARTLDRRRLEIAAPDRAEEPVG